MARKMIKLMFVSMLVVVMVMVMALSASAASYAPPASPVINSFTASATSITAGDTVTVSWDVSNADFIEIQGIEKVPDNLPAKGEMEFWPMASTTIILTAFNNNGTAAVKTIDVNVDAEGTVEILEFKADKTQVTPGETVMLSWKVLNAKSIEIIGLSKVEEKDLPTIEGSLEVLPEETTSYLLQAVGFKGEMVSATVVVNMVDKVVSIDSLDVDPAEITLGEKATISWATTNAANVKIQGIGDVTEDGSVEVMPDTVGTVTYTLVATGPSGDTATKSVNLVVKEPVKEIKILKFEADKTEVSRGTLVRLSWETENADGCMLVTSDGLRLMNRPANGGIAITPNKTRDYTLIAYDGQQNTVEKTITIVVK